MSTQITDVQSLDVRVTILERELSEMRAIVSPAPSREEVLAPLRLLHAPIAELSLECFPDGVRFRESFDHETGEPFFIVEADFSGTAAEMTAVKMKWVKLVTTMFDDSILNFRLVLQS